MKELTVAVAPDLPRLAPWHYALDVAVGWEARLRAVMVNDSFTRGAHVFADGDVLSGWLEKVRSLWDRSADQIEERIRAQARSRGVGLEVIRREGRVVEHVLEDSPASGLTVVGRGRNSEAHPGSLGSRCEALARRCTGPLFMSPLEYQRPRRVVAAYAAKSLGDRVLDLGSSLADAWGTGLIVLTAGEDRARIETIQRRAREHLADRKVSAEYVVKIGRPAEVIPSGLRAEDVLVLGPHGRSPIYRMLLGRVTDHVIRSVPGPLVLTAREDG